MATDRAENPYDRFAEIHAWRFSRPEAAQNKDILFYVRLAHAATRAGAALQGGPVLELACGWGRVAMALARAGFEVTGIDLSERMLAAGRKRLERESPKVQARVHFMHGDMSDFSLPRRFPLILIPFNSLQCLACVEDQRKTLACAARHLEEGGRLAFEVNSRFKDLPDDTSHRHKWTQRWPERNLAVMAYERVRQDREKQATVFDMIFELVDDRGHHERTEVRETLLWASREKTEELLRSAGLKAMSVFGDFGAHGATTSPEDRIIIVAESA